MEKFSYTKIDTFKQCPMKFKKKYEEGKYAFKSTLPLELGTITHKGKELVAQALIDGRQPDYGAVEQVVKEGYHDPGSTRNPRIAGTDELKERYFFEWVQKDRDSGLSYDDKLKIYFEQLPGLEHNPAWHPIACELPIDFVFDGKYRFTGFVDELEENQNGDLRIVDYKSSKKVYRDQEIKTPLQMVIYDLGIEKQRGIVPKEHVYDFMLIGKSQAACSKGYLKRGISKLAKLFEELEQCRITGHYIPKPSPLCHWCDYCGTNPNADEQFKLECRYHSLWTSTNKVYSVKQKYDPANEQKAEAFWF